MGAGTAIRKTGPPPVLTPCSPLSAGPRPPRHFATSDLSTSPSCRSQPILVDFSFIFSHFLPGLLSALWVSLGSLEVIQSSCISWAPEASASYPMSTTYVLLRGWGESSHQRCPNSAPSSLATSPLPQTAQLCVSRPVRGGLGGPSPCISEHPGEKSSVLLSFGAEIRQLSSPSGAKWRRSTGVSSGRRGKARRACSASLSLMVCPALILL